jgi:hypothetical protein
MAGWLLSNSPFQPESNRVKAICQLLGELTLKMSQEKGIISGKLTFIV